MKGNIRFIIDFNFEIGTHHHHCSGHCFPFHCPSKLTCEFLVFANLMCSTDFSSSLFLSMNRRRKKKLPPDKLNKSKKKKKTTINHWLAKRKQPNTNEYTKSERMKKKMVYLMKNQRAKRLYCRTTYEFHERKKCQHIYTPLQATRTKYSERRTNERK